MDFTSKEERMRGLGEADEANWSLGLGEKIMVGTFIGCAVLLSFLWYVLNY